MHLKTVLLYVDKRLTSEEVGGIKYWRLHIHTKKGQNEIVLSFKICGG